MQHPCLSIDSSRNRRLENTITAIAVSSATKNAGGYCTHNLHQQVLSLSRPGTDALLHAVSSNSCRRSVVHASRQYSRDIISPPIGRTRPHNYPRVSIITSTGSRRTCVPLQVPTQADSWDPCRHTKQLQSSLETRLVSSRRACIAKREMCFCRLGFDSVSQTPQWPGLIVLSQAKYVPLSTDLQTAIVGPVQRPRHDLNTRLLDGDSLWPQRSRHPRPFARLQLPPQDFASLLRC